MIVEAEKYPQRGEAFYHEDRERFTLARPRSIRIQSVEAYAPGEKKVRTALTIRR